MNGDMQGPVFRRTINGVTRTETVIAYTFGSMWACVPCGQKSPEPGHPVAAGDLMDCYAYVCDECGTPIQQKKRNQ